MDDGLGLGLQFHKRPCNSGSRHQRYVYTVDLVGIWNAIKFYVIHPKMFTIERCVVRVARVSSPSIGLHSQRQCICIMESIIHAKVFIMRGVWLRNGDYS